MFSLLITQYELRNGIFGLLLLVLTIPVIVWVGDIFVSVEHFEEFTVIGTYQENVSIVPAVRILKNIVV